MQSYQFHSSTLLRILFVCIASGILLSLSWHNFSKATDLHFVIVMKQTKKNLEAIKDIGRNVPDQFGSVGQNEVSRILEQAEKERAFHKEIQPLIDLRTEYIIYGWIFGVLGLIFPGIYFAFRWVVRRYSAVES